MRTTNDSRIGKTGSRIDPQRTRLSASAILALALNAPAWVLYLIARDEAREEFLGGTVEFLLAVAIAGGAVLVAGMGVIAASVDAHDRGEPVGPSIRLGLVVLGVSLGSVVLFFVIPNDGAGLIGP